jgi:hypothetical protein
MNNKPTEVKITEKMNDDKKNITIYVVVFYFAYLVYMFINVLNKEDLSNIIYYAIYPLVPLFIIRILLIKKCIVWAIIFSILALFLFIIFGIVLFGVGNIMGGL